MVAFRKSFQQILRSLVTPADPARYLDIQIHKTHSQKLRLFDRFDITAACIAPPIVDNFSIEIFRIFVFFFSFLA